MRTKQALIEIFGTSGSIDTVSFSGKTDLQILREALEPEGITSKEIWNFLPQIELAYMQVLKDLADSGPVFDRCPGVGGLLDSLSSNSNYLLSLVTGNLERLAHTKLESVGLSSYFSHRGAFGSDHEDRRQLPTIASNRIHQSLNLQQGSLSPSQFVVIGDTPRDIDCAHHFGAKAIAVSNGRYSTSELNFYNPDFVFENFSDIETVIAAIDSL